MTRPKVNSAAQQELDKAQENLEHFNARVSELSGDINAKPKPQETEPQTKLSAAEVKKAPEIYLKPERVVPPGPVPKTGVMKDLFNDKWRDNYEHDKKFVRFVAENHEIIGESIEIWTRPYPGMPAEFWRVPVNKPVWGPRYLAEQIKRKNYRRLKMEEASTVGNQISSDGVASYFGKIVAETTVQRLDAKPAPEAHFSFHNRVSNF